MKKNTPSEFLKDCLADAVIRLLEKYPLNEIQVKQICDVSGYHRSSWFRAFRSKHESVTYKMIRLWQVWTDVHGVTVRDEFTLDNADAFFQYNYEIRDTTRLLYRRGLMGDISKSFTAILYAHHREEPREAYKASIFAYLLFGILYLCDVNVKSKGTTNILILKNEETSYLTGISPAFFAPGSE